MRIGLFFAIFCFQAVADPGFGLGASYADLRERNLFEEESRFCIGADAAGYERNELIIDITDAERTERVINTFAPTKSVKLFSETQISSITLNFHGCEESDVLGSVTIYLENVPPEEVCDALSCKQLRTKTPGSISSNQNEFTIKVFPSEHIKNMVIVEFALVEEDSSGSSPKEQQSENLNPPTAISTCTGVTSLHEKAQTAVLNGTDNDSGFTLIPMTSKDEELPKGIDAVGFKTYFFFSVQEDPCNQSNVVVEKGFITYDEQKEIINELILIHR